MLDPNHKSTIVEADHAKDPRPLPAERRSNSRQVSVLRAALVDIDGLTHFCRIVNVSSRGLELRLYRAVGKGSRVQVRLPSEHCIVGSVVWSRGKSAGVRLDRSLDTAAFTSASRLDPRARRRLPRASVKTGGRLRVGMTSRTITLFDISPAGARISVTTALADLGPAFLQLPGLREIPARICWISGLDAGLMFSSPLEMHALETWIEQERLNRHEAESA